MRWCCISAIAYVSIGLAIGLAIEYPQPRPGVVARIVEWILWMRNSKREEPPAMMYFAPPAEGDIGHYEAI